MFFLQFSMWVIIGDKLWGINPALMSFSTHSTKRLKSLDSKFNLNAMSDRAIF